MKRVILTALMALCTTSVMGAGREVPLSEDSASTTGQRAKVGATVIYGKNGADLRQISVDASGSVVTVGGAGGAAQAVTVIANTSTVNYAGDSAGNDSDAMAAGNLLGSASKLFARRYNGVPDDLPVAGFDIGGGVGLFLGVVSHDFDGHVASVDTAVGDDNGLNTYWLKSTSAIWGRYDTTPDAIVNGEFGHARMNSLRQLYVELETALPAGTNTIGGTVLIDNFGNSIVGYAGTSGGSDADALKAGTMLGTASIPFYRRLNGSPDDLPAIGWDIPGAGMAGISVLMGTEGGLSLFTNPLAGDISASGDNWFQTASATYYEFDSVPDAISEGNFGPARMNSRRNVQIATETGFPLENNVLADDGTAVHSATQASTVSIYDNAAPAFVAFGNATYGARVVIEPVINEFDYFAMNAVTYASSVLGTSASFLDPSARKQLTLDCTECEGDLRFVLTEDATAPTDTSSPGRRFTLSAGTIRQIDNPGTYIHWFWESANFTTPTAKYDWLSPALTGTTY